MLMQIIQNYFQALNNVLDFFPLNFKSIQFPGFCPSIQIEIMDLELEIIPRLWTDISPDVYHIYIISYNV